MLHCIHTAFETSTVCDLIHEVKTDHDRFCLAFYFFSQMAV